MSGLSFSAPYNKSCKIIHDLKNISNKSPNGNLIDEIYFSDSTLYGSGRIQSGTSDTVETLKLIHSEGIRANLVLNSTCPGSEGYSEKSINSLISGIMKIHSIEKIDSVTIANPLIIQLVRNRIPDIGITASVLAEIDSPQRAMFYEKLGADTLVPDRDINRDLGRLKAIKESVSCNLRLMVNEGCLYRCPYRLFHFNYISHKSREKEPTPDHFFHNCHLIDKIDPSQVMKSNWIRPEDVSSYRNITDIFKIAGRTREDSWIRNTAKAYLDESYDGNLLDLMDSNLYTFKTRFGAFIDNKSIDKFQSIVTTCKKDCHACDYCARVARECIAYSNI